MIAAGKLEDQSGQEALSGPIGTSDIDRIAAGIGVANSGLNNSRCKLLHAREGTN
jgi:hypothetical protein